MMSFSYAMPEVEPLYEIMSCHGAETGQGLTGTGCQCVEADLFKR